MSARRLGLRAAQNRTTRLRGGQTLTPQKEALLAVTGRLLIHLENASNHLYRTGEATADGDPKLMLSRLLELSREVRTNLAVIFGDDTADPLAKILGGDR